MADWSLLQLTEFFSAITRAGDVASAARIAVQRATEATEAEVAAVIGGGEVGASVGLGRNPDPALFTGLRASAETTTFPGIGPMYVTTHPLDRDTDGRLLLARADESFTAEERQMLQGMARVLGLALRGLRTLENERRLRREREQEADARLALLEALEWRERLLETLLGIQRAANQQTPLGEVLRSITDGAQLLLDDVTTALVLRESGDAGGLTVASLTRGAGAPHPGPDVLVDAARRAMEANCSAADGSLAAVPVHIGDDVAGGFVIAGHADTGRKSEWRDVLAAFGEQASLALTGASTLAAVHAAHHDPLTGLPNRSLFRQRVQRTLAAGPDPATAALLYLDLDLFKQVNDTLGHSTGDELLRGVADRLSGVLRSSDMAARLGGDEFAVLVEPLTGVEQAHDIAQRVLDAIARPFEIAGRVVTTRASVGISYNRIGHSVEELVEEADLAMYRAKKTLPGTYREFEQSMHTGPAFHSA
ncbi:GGDEF domain-containing protein [Actinoplanes sp. NPDC026619]|uniref:GGDEF domain-containing protein n=1 Tax=Actinoplanes sp. NPDC026619 TaxID=3155798 RepID=UPI0034060474